MALGAVAEELVAAGCRGVILTGGEPLLRPAWSELASKLHTAGVQVALVTNGTLLDDVALERCEASGVTAVGVSLDGLEPTHDGIRLGAVQGQSPFQSATDALRRAARRLSTVAITQVNQRNLRELPAMGALLSSLGVSRWQIQLAIPLGRLQDLREPFILVPEQLPELARFLTEALVDPSMPMIEVSDTIGYCTAEDALLRGKRGPGRTLTPGLWTGCAAGIRGLAITYDGKVRGCSALPPELDVGDLHEESLARIWSERSRFGFVLDFDPSRLSGACLGCDLGGLCRGGCTTMAYWATGTLGNNPYCLRGLRRRSMERKEAGIPALERNVP